MAVNETAEVAPWGKYDIFISNVLPHGKYDIEYKAIVIKFIVS